MNFLFPCFILAFQICQLLQKIKLMMLDYFLMNFYLTKQKTKKEIINIIKKYTNCIVKIKPSSCKS